MLRIALTRAVPAARTVSAARPVTAFASVWSSNQSRLASSGGSTSKGNTSSPAERPPRPNPSSTQGSDPAKFDPIVNDLSKPDGPRTINASGSASHSSDSHAANTGTESGVVDPASIPAEPVIPDKPDLSALPSLDIDPFARPAIEAGESEGKDGKESGRTGASAKHSESSIERQRRQFTRLMLATVLIGGSVGAWYLGGQETPASQKVDTSGDNPVTARFKRFKANFSDLTDIFNKPAFEKLLPDPLPPPHQRPYTLLIDLEDLLVTSTWDRKTGWKTAKRPGVDYFIAYLSQFYEIVLFTSQPSYTAAPIAEKLDPFGAYMPYRLFRESTRYINGKVVKDLSYLNRDLSKVILLDTKAEHGSMQPENTIVIPPWKGTRGDKGLVDMIPFLESIGIFAPPDVRPILKAYEGKNIPIEYAKREAERKQQAIEEWEREHGGTLPSSGGAGWLSQMFGGLGGAAATRPTQPMTYLEQKRALAQQLYKEEQEYWAKNADEIKRLMEEDRQKQMAEQKGSLLSLFSGPPPPSADQAGSK